MADTGSMGKKPARRNAEPSSGPVGMRILLVEDNVDTAQTLAAILRQQKHEVWIASDGPGALEIAQAQQPDIVLLDIGLPGMDGYQVAERLRKEGMKKRPLLITLTAHGQKQDRLHSYQVGVDLHLTKPISPDELLQFLEHYQKVTAKTKR
jgi:CheY-like chemotaxis protein